MGIKQKSSLDPNKPELLRSVDLALPSALVLQAGDTIHLWATPCLVLVWWTAFHICLDSDIKRDFASSERQHIGALGRYRGQPKPEAPGASALPGWRSGSAQGLWPRQDWKLRLDALLCRPVPWSRVAGRGWWVMEQGHPSPGPAGAPGSEAWPQPQLQPCAPQGPQL